MALGSGRVSTNNFACAKWIVDTNGIQNGATHTTIQSAIDSASAEEVIVVKPGTYVENITLKSGIQITSMGYTSGSLYGATIQGKITPGTATNVTIQGFELTGDADYIFEDTGSATGNINFTQCHLTFSDNDCIAINNANRSLTLNQCAILRSGAFKICDITTGSVGMKDTSSFGANPVACTIAAGNYTLVNCYSWTQPITTSGTASVVILDSRIFLNSDNLTALNLNSTATHTISGLDVSTGTASSISVGANSVATLEDVRTFSTNANPITGAGTIHYASIDCLELNTATIDVTTQNTGVHYYGVARSIKQPAFSAYLASGDANVTGDGTAFLLGDTDVGTALTEIFDQGNNFVTGSASGAIFTAPVTGRYNLEMCVLAQSVATANTCAISIVTSNRTWTYGNTGTSFTGNMPLAFSALVDMDANDTATFSLNVGGGTKIVDIFGDAGPRTYVCGDLRC